MKNIIPILISRRELTILHSKICYLIEPTGTGSFKVSEYCKYKSTDWKATSACYGGLHNGKPLELTYSQADTLARKMNHELGYTKSFPVIANGSRMVRV